MAKEQAPAFQFYVRDWLASGSVAILSLEERGAYITLLARCWLMVELPPDGDELAALAGASSHWWAKHGGRILRQFERTETGYRNVRLDDERTKQDAYRSKQSGRATAGWETRHGNATAMPRQRPEDALLSSSSSSSSEVHVPATPDASTTLLEARMVEQAPSLPAVRVWTDARRRLWKTRWREHPDIGWWADLLVRIEASDFLCGRAPTRDGHASFKADVFWCLKPDNLAKILEGRYDNRTPVNSSRPANAVPLPGAFDCPHDPRCRRPSECVTRSGSTQAQEQPA